MYWIKIDHLEGDSCKSIIINMIFSPSLSLKEKSYNNLLNLVKKLLFCYIIFKWHEFSYLSRANKEKLLCVYVISDRKAAYL